MTALSRRVDAIHVREISNFEHYPSPAMHAANAIPHVCAAEAGIRTLLDLPWMMGRGLFANRAQQAPAASA